MNVVKTIASTGRTSLTLWFIILK